MRYESARLFVERARAVQPSYVLTARDVVAATTICQRLDGIPLAIELAASRVRGLTPGQIARHIEDSFRVLSGGNRTALPRQQTLRAAFDWSHDLLTETERALLRALSVFAGGFTLEAAEVVCGRPAGDEALPGVTAGPSADQVLDVLLQLIDGSLVQVENEESGESRYRLLGPIHQYALEKLRAEGTEATLRRRHLAWCLDLAERGAAGRFGPDAAVWAEQLAIEHDNMRAALVWGLADPDTWSHEPGLRLAGVLHHVWYHRDQLSEGRQWLERFLTVDRDRGREADVGRDDGGGAGAAGWDVGDVVRLGTLGAHPRVVALNGLGHLAYNQQDLGQAGERVAEALGLARGLDDVHGAGHALISLGQLALAQGDHDRAAALLEEGRALCSGLEYPFGQWRALNHLGETYTFQGDYERAGRLHQEGLALARSMGYYWSIAQALRQVGLLAYRQGEYERAAEVLEESIAWWREGRATRGLQWSHAELGHVGLARGDRVAAAAHYVESLTLCQQVGDRHGIAISLEGLAAVAGAEATAEADVRIVRAARLLGAATVLREAIGIPVSPLERPTVERAENAGKARLGAGAFATAWAEGRALPLDVVVDDAIDLARSSGPATVRTSALALQDDGLSGGVGATLTVREQEVAILIARGQTNRQIADTLAIAERTASTHVTNILGKLGFATRTQVAGWVVGQGWDGRP